MRLWIKTFRELTTEELYEILRRIPGGRHPARPDEAVAPILLTSNPSKTAKNVGAEVLTDFGADKIGQKCGRRGQL